MQFKLERFWSGTSAKFFVTTSVAAFLLLGVYSKPSLAILTVTPVSKTNAKTLGNVQNGVYFYPFMYTTAQQSYGTIAVATPTPIPSFGVIDPGVSFIDLGEDPNPSNPNTAAGGPPTDPGVIYFNVQSSNASFPSQAVIVATMSVTANTAPFYLVPIISVNGSYCSTSSCIEGSDSNQTGNAGEYFFGANYNQGQVMTIGVSPNAFCKSISENTGSIIGAGCGGFPFLAANAGTSVSILDMNFNFEIFAQQDLVNALALNPQVIPSTTPQDGPTNIPLEFESIGPQVIPSPTPAPTPEANCAFADGMESAVQGGIQVNTGEQFFTINGDPAGSDPNQIIVIAAPSPQATLNATAQTYLNNVIATPVPAADQLEQVSGFQPSTSASSPYWYTVGFLAEDAAGFVFDPGSGAPNSCVFPYSFDTSNVQGFLQQSKCFIATAAFRSMDSAPLVLLRSFRDNFLEHFGLGQSFVHWYYDWSPDAAEWLIDHPIFRFPVLLALIPLQIFAWIVLHPFLLLFLFVSSLLVFGFSLLSQSTMKIGRSTE